MSINEVWNGWKVESLIGEGSFGKVYKITRKDFGHQYVAAMKVIEIPQNQSEIKSIRSEGMNDDSITTYYKSVVENIVEEFTLMSKLKGHSNIVSYEDHMVVPNEDGFGWKIYIRMELLTPFVEYIENNNLTGNDVIKLGIDMCSALEVCEKRHILHRDIKPENIFVSELGTYKLGDFGIARQFEQHDANMSKKGTYTYMAPEVYKGQEYDSTVDIYSLGIVMYRMLNKNRAPFMPPASESIRFSDKERANSMRFNGEVIPPPCNASSALADIVLKACQYNPKERYQTAREMRVSLERLLKASEHNYDTVQLTDTSYDGEGTVLLDESEFDEEGTMLFEEQDYNNDSKSEEPEYQQPKVSDYLVMDSYSNEDKENKSKLKGIVIACIVLLIIVLGIIGTLIFFNNFKEEEEDVEQTSERVIETESSSAVQIEVADFTGKKIDEAKEFYKSKNIEVIISLEESDSIEKDIIISQNPKDGFVSQGKISFVVSKGAELVKVPKLEGLYYKDAMSKLKEYGLEIKKDEEFSDKVEKGVIISQDISKDTEVKKNTLVTVVVSKGKKPEETTKQVEVTESVTEDQDIDVVTELGSYNESNIMDSSKVLFIKNSVMTYLGMNTDEQKSSLARYMSANRLNNASGTYSSLTNGGAVNWQAKIFTGTAESDSDEVMQGVVEQAIGQIGSIGGSYGIGVSSFRNGNVGFNIYIVIVY